MSFSEAKTEFINIVKISKAMGVIKTSLSVAKG